MIYVLYVLGALLLLIIVLAIVVPKSYHVDKHVGKDFEEGLAELQTTLEN